MKQKFTFGADRSADVAWTGADRHSDIHTAIQWLTKKLSKDCKITLQGTDFNCWLLLQRLDAKINKNKRMLFLCSAKKWDADGRGKCLSWRIVYCVHLPVYLLTLCTGIQSLLPFSALNVLSFPFFFLWIRQLFPGLSNHCGGVWSLRQDGRLVWRKQSCERRNWLPDYMWTQRMAYSERSRRPCILLAHFRTKNKSQYLIFRLKFKLNTY